MGAHDRRNVDAVEQAPLRAKGLGKLRLPARVAAREANVRVMRAATEGIPNCDLGANIGGELAGCQAREGAVVLTPGEVAMLLPLSVASRTFLELLLERLDLELRDEALTEMARLRLTLAKTHAGALLACVAAA